MKPTTDRAVGQRFVAVGVYFQWCSLASTGGGLSRCRWAALPHEQIGDTVAGIPGVAVILENQFGQVLLQLRENKPGLPFANHWTLPGGRVESEETSLAAAYRELREELGMAIPIRLWQVYDRVHESGQFIIEQYVFVGRTQHAVTEFTLGEGVELRYVAQQDLEELPIAYGFAALLEAYFAGNLRGA